MKNILKNVLKFIAFISGCILIFVGFGSIFLWKSKVDLGFSLAFLTWGILLIWYFKKR